LVSWLSEEEAAAAAAVQILAQILLNKAQRALRDPRVWRPLAAGMAKFRTTIRDIADKEMEELKLWADGMVF